MSIITPYANESDAVSLGDLSIENRTDRISIFGSIDLTRDKQGLESAKVLKDILCAVVAALESESLPDRITLDSENVVGNPFSS